MKEVIILGIGMILLYADISYGCLGARPLAMGGAFVAVADDIHSCYWNPAGMGNIKNLEFTTMQTLNNRDITNYQKWLAGAAKIGNFGGIGGSYVHTIEWWIPESRSGPCYVSDDKWKMLSIGGYGPGILKNTGFGINMRQVNSTLKEKGYHTSSAEGYDIGILHHINEQVTIGMLVQNINNPKNYHLLTDSFRWSIMVKEYPRNFRPGIAWKPDNKTIFAFDCYNFTLDNFFDKGIRKQTSVRIGFERWLSDGFAIRAGVYQGAFHTLGFGVRWKLPDSIKLQIDYGIMANPVIGTHLLSGSISW